MSIIDNVPITQAPAADTTEDLLYQLEKAKLDCGSHGFTIVHRDFITRIQNHIANLEELIDYERGCAQAAAEQH